jgi:hypothetical protein
MKLYRVCLELVLAKPAPMELREQSGAGLVETQVPVTDWMHVVDAYDMIQRIKRHFAAPIIDVETKRVFIFGLQECDTDQADGGNLLARVPPIIEARVERALAAMRGDPAMPASA